MNALARRSRAMRAATILFAGAGLVLLAGYFLSGQRIGPGLIATGAQTVANAQIAVVQLESALTRREVVGQIESRVPIEVASRVAATIKEITVRAGDAVRQGQVLARLDSADLEAQVRQAQGRLAAAQAEYARASADEKRFRSLLALGSATPHEFDRVEAAYRATAAAVSQSEAGVAGARAALKYTEVRSPIAGIVQERLAEPGDLAMPGRPLVKLYSEKELRVSLQMPEALGRHVRVGTPLVIRVDAVGVEVSAAVSEIVPAADPSTRSFVVRANLPSGRGLRPGMFARATFVTGHEDILTIPRAAISEVGQLTTVRVVSQGGVELRQVALGRTFGNRVEILAGLNPGERVLVGPLPASRQ
jgi:membrane fusion protein (multidrug efflux system)